MKIFTSIRVSSLILCYLAAYLANKIDTFAAKIMQSKIMFNVRGRKSTKKYKKKSSK